MYIYKTYLGQNNIDVHTREKITKNLRDILISMHYSDKIKYKIIPSRYTVQTEINTTQNLSELFLYLFKKTYKTKEKNINYFETIIANENIFKEFFNAFNQLISENESLHDFNKQYTPFQIPKRKGGYRNLEAPSEILLKVQQKALYILDNIYKVHEHNAAHAYVKKRNNITNASMHKLSNYVFTADVSDFFTNIKQNELHRHLTMLHEFAILNMSPSTILKYKKEFNDTDLTNITPKEYSTILNYYNLTKRFINHLVRLAVFDNYLPQGSALSPKLSNLYMVPFDYTLTKMLKANNNNASLQSTKQYYIYTRYSDDIAISALNDFQQYAMLQMVKATLDKTSDLSLNPKKTKYLTTKYRCYITGVKINKNHNISYGSEKKEILKQSLFKLMLLKKEGNDVTEEAQELLGIIAYARSIEPEYFQELIRKYAVKFNVNPRYIHKYLLNK